MTRELFLDFETRSPIDIRGHGLARYLTDVRPLLLAWAIDDAPTQLWDSHQGEPMPAALHEALLDPDCLVVAHNAAFERGVLHVMGYEIPIERWRDTAAIAASLGLPSDLATLSRLL